MLKKNMLKKKSLYLAMVIVGLCLLGAALLLGSRAGVADSVSGVCIGIGAALFGVGLSGLVMRRWEKTRPQLMRQNEIEFADERNTMIRNRAKAVAGDALQWCVIALAFVAILADAPLWLTLVIVGVFLLKNVVEMALMAKYQQEL